MTPLSYHDAAAAAAAAPAYHNQGSNQEKSKAQQSLSIFRGGLFSIA